MKACVVDCFQLTLSMFLWNGRISDPFRVLLRLLLHAEKSTLRSQRARKKKRQQSMNAKTKSDAKSGRDHFWFSVITAVLAY
jgi:hypothetical protein